MSTNSTDLSEFSESFFSWWNGIIEKDEETKQEEFSLFFSNDAEIITNGKLVCKGLADITRHFMVVRQKTDFCRVRLPMERIFFSGNQIFVHYLIDASFDTEKQIIAVMGYMLVEQKKITVSQQLQHLLAWV